MNTEVTMKVTGKGLDTAAIPLITVTMMETAKRLMEAIPGLEIHIATRAASKGK